MKSKKVQICPNFRMKSVKTNWKEEEKGTQYFVTSLEREGGQPKT